jgi:hypothetical protein
VIAAIAIFGSGGGKSDANGEHLTTGVVKPPVTSAPPPAAASPPPPPVRTPPPPPVPPPVPTFEVSVVVDPPTGAIELDGELVGQGRFERTVPRDHQRHRLRIAATGYVDKIVEFTDSPPPPVVRLARVPRPATVRPPPVDVAPRPIPRAVETPHNLNPNGAPVID